MLDFIYHYITPLLVCPVPACSLHDTQNVHNFYSGLYVVPTWTYLICLVPTCSKTCLVLPCSFLIPIGLAVIPNWHTKICDFCPPPFLPYQ